MDGRKIVEEIYRLEAEVKAHLAKETELYMKAQENKDKIVPEVVDRSVTEGDLWEEIRLPSIGLHSPQGQIMREKYSELFDSAEKREKANLELFQFVQKELGMNFQKMSIADYLKLTEMVVAYQLEKK